jgi:hypothetical protein
MYVVPAQDGAVGIKVDRICDQVGAMESQMRVICVQLDQLPAPATTPSAASNYDFVSCVATDDWISMSAQFNEFRVKAIQFQCTLVNPSTSVFTGGLLGVTHINFPSATSASFTAANVVDMPYSKVLDPGAATVSAHWLARGPLEMQFQDTTVAGNYRNFGGIYVFPAVANSTSFTYAGVIVKYIVDFRGRR